MDEMYEYAVLSEARRAARLDEAQIQLDQAMREVAQLRAAEAIAIVRALVPDATEMRFTVSDGDNGKYAVIHRIDDRQANSVLFNVDEADEYDVDYDALTPAEDFLAGAAEAGAEFPRGDYGGKYVLRLVP